MILNTSLSSTGTQSRRITPVVRLKARMNERLNTVPFGSVDVVKLPPRKAVLPTTATVRTSPLVTWG